MATKTNDFSISKEKSGSSIDDKVTITSNSHASSMMQSIYSAYKEGRYCDVSLCVDDKKIFCHSLVLSGMSDYFKALFEMDERNTNEFILHDVDFSHLEKIVEFAYTGKLDVHKEEVQRLMISANFFKISPIESLCEAHMLKSASIENCIDYFMFAYTYGFESIQQFCMELYGENFEVMCDRKKISMLPFNFLQEIMKDDDLVVLREDVPILSSERELALFRGALQYINETVEGKRHSKEILECVRFQEIQNSDVMREIEKWPELKPMAEIKEVLKVLESRNEIEYPIEWTNARKFSKFTFRKYPNIICPGGKILHLRHTERFGITTCEDIPITDCIKSIKFFLRTLFHDILVIGGLVVEYDSGIKREYGGKAGDEAFVQENCLQLNRGEMITVVESCSGWLLSRLVFETSDDRRLGPIGGPNEHLEKFSTADWNDKRTMYLHGFTGTNIETENDPAFIDLELIWKYYERKSSSTAE